MAHDLSLAVSDLAPRRAGRAVAAGVSFALTPGQALVLRGPNGSGKTSVLRAVAGLCPYGGEVAFAADGGPADPGAARAGRVHLLAPGEGLAARLTPAEHVRFWAALYGSGGAGGAGDAGGAGGLGALARVGLGEGEADQAAGALSTGQRRRLGLARLLMAPRALWLLDEPLSGLDAAGRDLLAAAIAGHRAAGGLVLMATHEAPGLPGAATLRLKARR